MKGSCKPVKCLAKSAVVHLRADMAMNILSGSCPSRSRIADQARKRDKRNRSDPLIQKDIIS
jgi:hypothetical protein